MKSKINSPASPWLSSNLDAQAAFDGTQRSQHGTRLDAYIESAIGENLRAVYRDVLTEPVPERFVSLLDGLVKKAERK